MGTQVGRADGVISKGGRSPVEFRSFLGSRLRRYREGLSISRAAAAQAIGVSDTTISGLEHGRISLVRLEDVLDLCELYAVHDHDERTLLLDLARKGNAPGWWSGFADVIPTWFEPYLALEQTAVQIRSFDGEFVPGLLQTADYARSVILMDEGGCSESELEHRLALRLLRQRRLGADGAPRLWAIIDEAALRKRVAARATMFRQLQHLAELCDRPGLRIQVLPTLSRGHFTGGPIILLTPPGDPVDVVYLEQLTTALYIDAPDDVLYYRHVLNSLGTIAPEPLRTPEILRQIMREV